MSRYQELFLEWEKNQDFKYLSEWEAEEKQKQLCQEEKQLLGRLFFCRSQSSTHLPQIERDFLFAAMLLENQSQAKEQLAYQALELGLEKRSLPLLRLSFESLERGEELNFLLSHQNTPKKLEHLAEAYFQYGKQAKDTPSLEKALRACQVLQMQSSSTEKARWQWRMAECYFLIGDSSEEVVDFFQALKLFSQAAYYFDNEWEFCLLQGICYQRVYQLINAKDYLYQAKECFEKALFAKDDALTALKLIQSLIILYSIDTDDVHATRSFEVLKKLASHPTLKGSFHLETARLLLLKGKAKGEASYVQEALQHFSKSENEGMESHKLKPYKIEALIFLGCEYESLDLLKKVECFFQEAISVGDELEDLLSRVHYLLALGNYFGESSYFHEAIGHLKEYKGPKEAKVLYFFSQAYYELFLSNQSIGHLSRANIFIKQALHLEPNQALYWGLSGSVLSKIGEIEEDRSLLEEANEMFEKAFDLRVELSYQDLPWLSDYGFNQHLQSEYDQQEEDLEKVVEVFQLILNIEPLHLDARYHLAQALLSLGSITAESNTLIQAVEQYQMLIKEDAEDPMVLNDLGETLITLSQVYSDNNQAPLADEPLKEAEEYLLQAIAMGSCEAFYNLACLFSIKGAYQQTLFYLQKALSVDGLPPVEEILEDEWLAGFRKSKLFKLFFSNLSQP